MKKTILLVLSVIWLSTNEIYACSCVIPKELLGKTIVRAFSQSDLVFVGKVIDKQFNVTEIYVPELDSKQKYYTTIYTFELINNFGRQSNKKEIEIVTTSNSCEIVFQVGEEYLVYSNRYDQRIAFSTYLNKEKVTPFYATSICTRTEKVNKVKKR